MGKRHTIVNRKTDGDKARGVMYAKMSKLIEIAAKKGGDVDLNPSLAMILQKAKQAGVTREIIDKAIKKGSGQQTGQGYTEMLYELIGPSNVVFYVKALTDNANRTATNIKTIAYKHNTLMGEPGSVAWQFVATGIVCIDGVVHKDMVKGNIIESIHPYNADILEEQAIDLGAQDIEYEEGICTISTIREDFARIQGALYDTGYHIIQGDIEYIPTNPLDADDALILQIDNCIDALNDDDDVQKIWTNLG